MRNPNGSPQGPVAIVIHEDPSEAAAITRWLENEGFEVLSPESPEAAQAAALDANPPALLVTSTAFHGLRLPLGSGALPTETGDAQARYRARLEREFRVQETRLRESEENYRQLFELESDAIFLVDNESGRILQANRAASLLYGYTQEELLEMRNTDLSEEQAKTRSVTTSTPPKPDEVLTIPLRWHRKKDGTRFPVEITGRFFVHRGRSVHIAAARDITKRLEAEAEGEKLQAQFLQSQKMESVGRLAGGVAHDFNNMLSVILGHAELALDRIPGDSPLAHELKEIRAAARRSADLTGQLLAFARMQTVAPKVLDLNEAAGSTLALLRRLIGEDVELVWVPGASLWPVMMDAAQMDQILANLTVNARDAISGVGQITLETKNVTLDAAACAGRPEFRAGDYVMLTFGDDGCGMDPLILPQVFEPFFTTKEVGRGTGLGLATVYGIVKQNGGFLEVESAPGEGARFKIFFPKADRAAAGAVEVETDHSPSGGGETILIVEDEEAILGVGRSMLERLGYSVLTAGTPTQAIRLAESHDGEIHLLLADVVMPEMDGRQVAARITALRPDMRCLFMSGYTADVIAHHGVLEEGVRFLQKPFSVPTLAAAVREALDGR